MIMSRNQIRVTLSCAAGAAIAAATILIPPIAKADTHDDAIANQYANQYAGAVCSTLADYPSVAGLTGILQAINQDGLTNYQAGEAVGISVINLCPQYTWIIDAFVNLHTPKSVTA